MLFQLHFIFELADGLHNYPINFLDFLGPYQPILHQGPHELFGPLGILGPFVPLEPLGHQGPQGPKSTIFLSNQSRLSIKLRKGSHLQIYPLNFR